MEREREKERNIVREGGLYPKENFIAHGFFFLALHYVSLKYFVSGVSHKIPNEV